MSNEGIKMPALKYKKLYMDSPSLVLPRDGDVGIDLYAHSISHSPKYIEYGTGIALDLPNVMFVDVRARSSISNYDLILANGIGTIDPSYKGEIKLRFKVLQANPKIYQIGDKIGQLLVYYHVKMYSIDQVEDLTISTRGSGGFGSTGT